MVGDAVVEGSFGVVHSRGSGDRHQTSPNDVGRAQARLAPATSGIDYMALHHSPKLAAVIRDPLLAARATGASPVVAFMSNQVPVELIHATGCFPLQLPTAPLAHTPEADRVLGPGCDPLVRNALERLLHGDFGCVDLLVLPGSIAAHHKLHRALCTLRRTLGGSLPESYLYDVVQAPWNDNTEYNQARMVELKQRLEALAGKPADEASLRASIALYNGVRQRLAQLIARRRAEPCLLAGATALEIFTAVQRLAPEAARDALDCLLAAPTEPATGTRTLLIGGPHDTPALHRRIARAGGQVVGDHHWRGEPLFGPAIDPGGAPLRAIGGHYHGDHVRSHTLPSNNEALVTFAKQARAEVAVFFYYAEDDASAWDFPAQSDALSAVGIPSLSLAREAYPPGDAAEATLRTFYDGVQRLARGVPSDDASATADMLMSGHGRRCAAWSRVTAARDRAMSGEKQTIHIEHEEADGRGAFFLEREGMRLAEMTYSRAGAQLIIIDHTLVDEQLRGLGVARRLLDTAVAWARKTQTRVRATCPYALAQFQKDESIRDVFEA